MTDRQMAIAVTCLGAGIFSAGFLCGQVNIRLKVRKRFGEAQNLIRNSFVNLEGQVKNGTMTRDEIDEYFEEQMNFVGIVTGRIEI